jgi:MoaA/NifB/PqqE/SkfB family radical SAM enzyme
MTNLCNAKCVHCDIWKNKGKDDTPTVDQYKADDTTTTGCLI